MIAYDTKSTTDEYYPRYIISQSPALSPSLRLTRQIRLIGTTSIVVSPEELQIHRVLTARLYFYQVTNTGFNIGASIGKKLNHRFVVIVCSSTHKKIYQPSLLREM